MSDPDWPIPPSLPAQKPQSAQALKTLLQTSCCRIPVGDPKVEDGCLSISAPTAQDKEQDETGDHGIPLLFLNSNLWSMGESVAQHKGLVNVRVGSNTAKVAVNGCYTTSS
ncbi:hypothetical protein J6590_051366 [Homalodisca vitripennis]|nr:hypothetical protein J6590_051366 [Homalodisca vitripennis]